jgi:hypothetical protein
LEAGMTFQILVIVLQLAALAAFLILWYFWIKKKLEASFLLEEEENVLFPFRYFSWIFIGVILVTCLVQVHFVRVSCSVHERMASFASSLKKQELNAKAIDELKMTLEKLRLDTDSNFKALKTHNLAAFNCAAEASSEAKPQASAKETRGPSNSRNRSALITAKESKPEGQGFAGAARAFSAPRTEEASLSKTKGATEDADKVYSMRLNLSGRTKIDNLRVRKLPLPDAPVVDKLMSGQEVKVTEKRIVNEGVWFRVVTPSGRAGWVDYRYLKLEGAA